MAARPVGFSCRRFAFQRTAGLVWFPPRPVENLGRRHSSRIDAKLLKRCLGAREMAFGYDGKTRRKIL
jgi:hypothetical protein